MLTHAHVCGVSRSILGQPWRWRGAAADGYDEGFRPDDPNALVLAEAVTEKFGGDSVAETARNIKGYLDNIPAALDTIGQ